MKAREVALTVCNEIREKDTYANVALMRALEKHPLSELDRRFVTELVYGTAKAGETLDWMLGRYLLRPPKKIPPVIWEILRLGAYQLFFMSKVPASAACNQAVELAKKYGHIGTAKFVNGVLRAAARQPEKAALDAQADDATVLARALFHPVWLVRRWLARFGAEETRRLCRFDNESAPLSARANALRCTRETLAARLAQEGVECRLSDWTPEGVVCTSHPAMRDWASLQEGWLQVQDESSMLVAHVLDPQPGEFVIDACSAPGGKATHMAALMRAEGRVLAVDIYEHKLATVRENAARLGAKNVEANLLDAALLGEAYPEAADRVLVDAPCSGLGVLRRKPDARWRRTEASLAELPPLQMRILRGAADAVRPGGVLVYSTCTIEPAENEDVVRAFLAARPDFTLEDASPFLPQRKKQGPMLQLLPQQDGVDGFFIARMRRVK